MPKLPKQGTIERIVLDKLMDAGDDGITYLDFTDPPISEERLTEVIVNLQSGMFDMEESEININGWH